MLCTTPTIHAGIALPAWQRRTVLTGLAAFAGSGVATAREPLTRRGTSQLTTGPFFPLTRPRDHDRGLTRVRGRRGVAQGVILELRGCVTTEAGTPLPGARLDIWQTNGFGRYHHASDESGLPYDPNFQGSAVLRTDAQGEYRLRTVMPQPYERRQRHIHFDVRGRRRMLITQMFFPGEPNERDTLYPALQTMALQQAVTATRLEDDAGVLQFRWNIVLSGE